MKFKYPVVSVHWLDAHHQNGEVKANGIEHSPSVQVCVGWLIRSDKQGVTLAMEYCEDEPEELRITWFIPRGMVKRLRHLTPRR